ncbi:hypothetical protein N7476_007408 [Penicillium atrosanguineum]|uniref:Uncharacterized protein n=1 Tax=Penicillium atrosanguineum TaxID=1132637 RepID=A0A9W9PXE5_9EURO|nr:hypothetical protein N7476_007408 [Penicillium atrosanguineum]
MAGIVNRPLSIFRRPESPKPLHSRWGDVAISVPTDGSWNQYDNPHRIPRRPSYGPGFVPDCSPSEKKLRQVNEEETEEADDDNKSTSTIPTIPRRNSLSLGGLGGIRAGRLSVRLASRPKHLRGESPTERDGQSDQRRPDFAYKPIQTDYVSEVSETSSQSTPRYQYIPASGRYMEDILGATTRSQSARSCRSSRTRRDSFSESQEDRDHDRDRHSRMQTASRVSSHQEDDRQSLRSSLGDSSDGVGSRLSSFGLPPRRRTSPFVAADRRSSSLKPMTLAMVPDPEDLY